MDIQTPQAAMPSNNLDRKTYNGIESFGSLGIQVAHYRVLDPGIGRWMQAQGTTGSYKRPKRDLVPPIYGGVDPKAEKFYGLTPYNSMGNNPVSSVDPNGDEFFTAAIVGALVGVISNGIQNSINGEAFFKGAGQAAMGGAIGGALAGSSLGVGAGMLKAGASVGSSYLPGVDIPIGNMNLNISPALMFSGSNSGWNIGANATLSGSIGPIDFAIGGGAGYGTDYFTGFSGWNQRYFGAIGAGGNMIGTSFKKAPCLRWQQIGAVNLQFGEFAVSYENDGAPFHLFKFGDGGDSYKSSSFRLGFRDLEIGLNIFTGEREFPEGKIGKPGEIVKGIGAHNFLMSPAYVGYRGFRVGFNDWHVGQAAQNWLAHKKIKPQAWFNWRGHHNRPIMQQYSGYFRRNSLSNW